MKAISLKTFAAIVLVGTLGTGGYVVVNAGRTADTPASAVTCSTCIGCGTGFTTIARPSFGCRARAVFWTAAV